MCLYCILSDSRLCNSLSLPCWLVGGSSPSNLAFDWHNIAFIIREWWISLFEIRKWRFGMSWEFGELHSFLRLEPGVVMWDKINERERMAQRPHTSHLSQFCLGSLCSAGTIPWRNLDRTTGNRPITEPGLHFSKPADSCCHIGWNLLN